MAETCYLFVGPSGAGLTETLAPEDGLRVLPPVKRGDIPVLRRSQPPGVIAIADGLFHAAPAVGHREILNALEAGWVVYGLCSIGALRAAEMVSFGVIPFGLVADRYVQDPTTPDDYVALLHGSGPDFVPLSEPYVHLERFLEKAEQIRLIEVEAAGRIREELTNDWYGYRTLARFTDLVLAAAATEQSRASLETMLRSFDRFRIKKHDLAAFIQERPWLERGRLKGTADG